jgi:hypothetical protein
MSPWHVAPGPSGRIALTIVALAALLACPVLAQTPRATPAEEGTPISSEVQWRALKRIQHDLLMQGARRRMAGAKARLHEQRESRRRSGTRRSGAHARRVEDSEESALPADLDRGVKPYTAQRTTAMVPANVRVNDPTGDASSAGQAEESVASFGSDVLVAWNDGQGFVTGGDVQTAGYSSDGGVTFTKLALPHPAAFPAWRWAGDPVFTVNEKSGRFYCAGLASSSSTTNALGVAVGHFTGPTFAWDTVLVVRSVSNATAFLDKEWCVADSATGNLYLTNTTFDAGGDHIDFYRLPNGGSSWLGPTQLSAPAENGNVQGSRPVLGPAGEIYVVWYSETPAAGPDDFNLRKSVDQGTNFAPAVTATTLFPQFGTGAPGFNRPSGITFPSIAVDRTKGTNRGRVYVTWAETWDVGSTGFTTTPGMAEVEPDGFAAAATPFTPGQTLRGQISAASPADLDWWSCNLAAGQSLVIWADSVVSQMAYTLRVFAPGADSLQRLCYGAITPNSQGQGAAFPNNQTFYEFTAPASGTYYLRIAPYVSNTPVGPYRIETASGAGPGSYRARDQRDVFVTFSDDGATWSTPSRVNDDGIGLDDWLPEVGVAADGRPYVAWFDFRDDPPYGSRANQYVSRSLDGGVTWQPSQRVTSATSNFTTCVSNIAPNEGDYSHVWGDARYLRPTWADGRGVNVDVWATAIDTWHSLTACPADRNVNATDVVSLSWTVDNLNPLFANDYTYALSSARGWPLPAPGTLNGVPAAGSLPLNLSIAVPDTAASGPSTLTLSVRNLMNTRVQQCAVTLSVTGAAGVGSLAYNFALAPVRPNPTAGVARLQYTLPRAGGVTLRIYGLRGEVVRTLVDGAGSVGVNSVTWDGRDGAGHPVAAGAYYARLEAFGRALTQRMVWIR